MKTIKKNPNGATRRSGGLKKLRGPHGGPRPGSGRPPKPDRDKWGQVTCVLRYDTIDRLRRSATPPDAKELTKYFGEYLQWHLDQYPPLDWATWQAFLELPQRITPPPIRHDARKRLSPAERAALKELKDAIKVK
jgi:hypothetical protein